MGQSARPTLQTPGRAGGAQSRLGAGGRTQAQAPPESLHLDQKHVLSCLGSPVLPMPHREPLSGTPCYGPGPGWGMLSLQQSHMVAVMGTCTLQMEKLRPREGQELARHWVCGTLSPVTFAAGGLTDQLPLPPPPRPLGSGPLALSPGQHAAGMAPTLAGRVAQKGP